MSLSMPIHEKHEATPASIRAQAEAILSDLGISAEKALNLFYQQVIISNGLPFKPGVVSKMPYPCMEDMTKEDLRTHIEEGYQDTIAGRTKPAETVFTNLKQRFSI